MTFYTVPWLPGFDGEMPSDVLAMLAFCVFVVGRHPGALGGAVARIVADDIRIDEDLAEWYLSIALELGMIGGVCAVTGADVVVESVPVGTPDRSAN